MTSGAEGSDAPEQPVDGRSLRWEDHKAARRKIVLDSALRAIDAEGSDVGVQQIAEYARLPRSVVYRLFRERTDLDEQVRAHIVSSMMETLAPALVPEGSVDFAINRAIHTYVEWIAAHPNLHQFLSTGPKRPARAAQSLDGVKTAFGLYVTDVVAAGLATLDLPGDRAEAVSFGLVGLVDGAVNQWLHHGEGRLPTSELADVLSSAALDVISGALRDLGVTLDREAPLGEITGDIRPLLEN
ncbi:TetR/AcrR family transcriptional regulator [Lolliginicoccus suaedae]|uniref:TetR/AcrR family transcriptional regulator n=1 Tax=Lolliginicoccus suaedae TaxID=2605429 RepID=UPI0011EDEF6A|nr:TetR/AcrR family transcriptional regulator [Lolliginicoccus suaedae]